MSLIIDGKVTEKPKLKGKFGNMITVIETRYKDKVDSFFLVYDKEMVSLDVDTFVHITGEVRTLEANNKIVKGYIVAKDIVILDKEPEKYENSIEIDNVEIYDIEELKSVGKNRVINLTLKINRKHSRFSIVHAECWNKQADEINGFEGVIPAVRGRLLSYKPKGSVHRFITIYVEELILNV